MDLKRKLVAGIASGSLMLSVFAQGALAGYSGSSYGCGTCGNGSYSRNITDISLEKNMSVDQTNNASISNTVNNQSNTGGNRISSNVGGSNTISTGDVNTRTNINNQANMNTLVLPHEDESLGSIPFLIRGNGSRGYNVFRLDARKEIDIRQNNNAHFDNEVNNHANTGGNSISHSTGAHGGWFYGKKFFNHNQNQNSDNTIRTGTVNTQTNINNEANSNTLR